jgi:hypothetical protein
MAGGTECHRRIERTSLGRTIEKILFKKNNEPKRSLL